MKKTLIAVALATLSATSMADVILYGKIKGGVEVTKVKGESGTTTQIVDYTSRIGFKGHEELNAGLKAIWQLEQGVNIGGSEGTHFGDRNSFIGLEGDFGRLTVGHQHNPVGDFAGDLDQWEYSSNAAGLGMFTRETTLAQISVVSLLVLMFLLAITMAQAVAIKQFMQQACVTNTLLASLRMHWVVWCINLVQMVKMVTKSLHKLVTMLLLGLRVLHTKLLVV